MSTQYKDDPASPIRRSRPTIPWRQAARRLAEGASPAMVAAEIGLDEDRIWRHLRRSQRFRFYLQQALERRQLLTGLQLGAAGATALLQRGLTPESLDGDMLRLLREATDDKLPGAAGLARQIDRLGQLALVPPNMALRTRIAAERRQMDLQVAEASGFLSGLMAGGRHKTASPPGRTGPDLSSSGPELSLNGSQRDSAVPQRPPGAGTPPVTTAPAFVDIDGPDRARLVAEGRLSRPALPADDDKSVIDGDQGEIRSDGLL